MIKRIIVIKTEYTNYLFKCDCKGLNLIEQNRSVCFYIFCYVN